MPAGSRTGGPWLRRCCMPPPCSPSCKTSRAPTRSRPSSPCACISAVNMAETLSKLVQHGKPLEAVTYQIDRLCLPVVPFDSGDAKIVATLWPPTRSSGLSLSWATVPAWPSASGSRCRCSPPNGPGRR